MIIIPMGGASRRFADAGYPTPKYMLMAHGRSVFAWAVNSFSRYFLSEPFLFVVRQMEGVDEFVRTECQKLGIKQFSIVILDAPTAGQSETVFRGLDGGGVIDDEPVTIFNIDTFRPNFSYPPVIRDNTDGYLEVFAGSGANWSYVRPVGSHSNLVAETAEKKPISNLCCTGLYYFRTANLFRHAYFEYHSQSAHIHSGLELYVAPMYNVLIRQGYLIRFDVINSKEVVFCGVPSEYESFLALDDPGI